MLEYHSWIADEWVPSETMRDVTNPYDGSVIARVAVAGEKELDRAITAAQKAFESYKDMPAHRRAEILATASRLIRDNEERLVSLLAAEIAKPVRDARVEVRRAANTFMFAAEEARRIRGEMIPLDALPGGEGRLAFTLREPLGVIGAITPFNVPLNLIAHKVAPALACGNTVVLKPTSQAPLTAFELARLLHEAGLPAGCLNVVCGPGGRLGDRLVEDPRVAMITFTGSAAVGKRIRECAGFKRVALELGSNSAVVIEDAADLDPVAARCVQGAYTFAGQVCISVQRIYVNEALYEPFLEKYLQRVAALRTGDPASEETEMSAMISPGESARVLRWVDEAARAGAKVETGGELTGSVVRPTVLTAVSESMKVWADEVFGPVSAVVSYRDFDAALAAVNRSRYGLQAGVYTRDLQKAFRAVKTLQVGGVMINDIPSFRVDHMPYGGVKESGMGREGVPYAVQEMTEPKLAVFNLGS